MPAVDLATLTDTVFFCDPSGGKDTIKRARARSAIVGVAQDDDARIFVLHAWAARVKAGTLLEKILEVNEEFRPRRFGIEANAMQVLFTDLVRREARFRETRLSLYPVQQPTRVDKFFRLRSTLQPVIGFGRLFVQAHQVELKEELRAFPMGETVDLVDALASAVELLPRKAGAGDRAKDDEVRYEEYLREVGCAGLEDDGAPKRVRPGDPRWRGWRR